MGGRAGLDTGDHKQGWITSSDAGRRQKGRIRNHLGNICAHTGNELAESSGAGRWHGQDKKELEFNCPMSTIPRIIGHATTMVKHGWVLWEGTVRTLARSQTP